MQASSDTINYIGINMQGVVIHMYSYIPITILIFVLTKSLLPFSHLPWYHGIYCDCSALNCDCGLVNCGTNILCGCWLFGQNTIQFYCGASSTIIAGNRHRRGRVTSCHLNWLLSVKLGSWSCQLWYQHPSRLLTIWTIRDSGLLWGIFDYSCREQTQEGESDVLQFDLIAQH